MTDKQKRFIRQLRDEYYDVILERVPDDMRELLAKLK